MKNKLLTLLACAAISFPAFSQTSDSVDYKNHFGIIASPSLQYLFQNRELPVGLIYKRQVNPDQAWRFTLSGWFQNQKNPFHFNSNSAFFLEQTSYFTTVLVGYEWQKEISNRWGFYYGVDGGVGYGKNKTTYDFNDFDSSNIGFFSNQHYDNTSVSFLLQPLAGLRFNVNSRLYLATETRIGISYSHSNRKNFETTFSQDQPPITRELSKLTYSSTNINYRPLSNIQLVYKF